MNCVLTAIGSIEKESVIKASQIDDDDDSDLPPIEPPKFEEKVVTPIETTEKTSEGEAIVEDDDDDNFKGNVSVQQVGTTLTQGRTPPER